MLLLMQRLLTDQLWAEIERLSFRSKKMAAVAYCTSYSSVCFGEGDILVVDASDTAIETGQTAARILRRAFDKGAAVYSVPDLHAKVLLFGDVAIVGSANLSNHSKDLFEAGIATDSSEVVRSAKEYIVSLAIPTCRIDENFLRRIENIKVIRERITTNTPHEDVVIFDGRLPVLPLPTGIIRCVNFSDGRAINEREVIRVWDDARRLQFVSAGGSPWYRDRIRSIRPGDQLIAYIKGKGVVGIGIAVTPAISITDFMPLNGSPAGSLLSQVKYCRNLNHNSRDLDNCEYCVSVLWQAWVPVNRAYRQTRLGNQNIVWLPRSHLAKEIISTFEHFGLNAIAQSITLPI
jgi:hypothetical protein